MRYGQQINHQRTNKLSALKGGEVLSFDDFVRSYSRISQNELVYGASGIAVISLSRIFCIIARGLSFLNIAVRMMVMMIETLRFPRLVMFPKVIFLNRTAFLMPCSAKLFVGATSGNFKNTISSSLNVISRLRMLSVSWCSRLRLDLSFLKRWRISLQATRYSASESTGCM